VRGENRRHSSNHAGGASCGTSAARQSDPRTSGSSAGAALSPASRRASARLIARGPRAAAASRVDAVSPNRHRQRALQHRLLQERPDERSGARQRDLGVGGAARGEEAGRRLERLCNALRARRLPGLVGCCACTMGGCNCASSVEKQHMVGAVKREQHMVETRRSRRGEDIVYIFCKGTWSLHL